MTDLAWINFFLYTIGVILIITFSSFTYISINEKQKRATTLSFIIFLFSVGYLFAIRYLPATVKFSITLIELFIIVLLTIIYFLPSKHKSVDQENPQTRFDERDIMFARARLVPGSKEFNSYYHLRPENYNDDEITRGKPGLFSNKSLYANPVLFAAANASFFMTENLSDAVYGPVNNLQQKYDTSSFTKLIKNVTKYYGALNVGITTMRPYHVYSHIGRGSGIYGTPIPVEHKYAIAFTVEMDHALVCTYPMPQGSMETAKQYVEASRVAVQLAAFIRNLGYTARAHIDGNYRVIAPLVARDANLGEIGRMGLLITPHEGPRVRIGVVTTNMELFPDPRKVDHSIIEFCEICKKCAENCPSRSIPFESQKIIDGAKRWKIN